MAVMGLRSFWNIYLTPTPLQTCSILLGRLITNNRLGTEEVLKLRRPTLPKKRVQLEASLLVWICASNPLFP